MLGLHKGVLIEKDEVFNLYIRQPVYKQKTCTKGYYWKNKITGQNCGRKVLLCEFRYNNDGSIKENYEIEEDVYELVAEKEN